MSEELNALLKIMQQLRDPVNGCPWDVEQDFKSISAYTIEEAYEVADAINRNNLEDLKDELGDLLLQVVFHSQMAKEQGAFEFKDVVMAICDKMTRRHPHVFADARISSAEELGRNWEAMKASEKSLAGKDKGNSLLDDVPANIPALDRASKLGKQAAKAGFDWPNSDDVMQKVDEELAELKAAVKKNDTLNIEEELGDLLFALTNYARHLKLNPETCLRNANQKFISRFQFIESELNRSGENVQSATLADMELLWNKAKLNLNRS